MVIDLLSWFFFFLHILPEICLCYPSHGNALPLVQVSMSLLMLAVDWASIGVGSCACHQIWLAVMLPIIYGGTSSTQLMQWMPFLQTTSGMVCTQKCAIPWTWRTCLFPRKKDPIHKPQRMANSSTFWPTFSPEILFSLDALHLHLTNPIG